VPKIVDWDERRDAILVATWRVIARDGLAKTTVRAIASEADCSQGILSHYFSDKEDILASALLLSHRRVRARTEAATDGLKGIAALRIAMLEALPLDEERELEARIEVSFWGRLLSNPELETVQRAEVDQLWSRLAGHLREAQDLGELAAGLDIEVATHELVVLIDGVSLERVHYPVRVPAPRQLELLDRVLDRLGAAPGSPAAPSAPESSQLDAAATRRAAVERARG
jgi:AcrR family transcriptional regulator